MKKLLLCLGLFSLIFMGSACTRQVVFLDRDINTVKADFDKYVKSTGYDYKMKDDENNIYNVLLYQYNVQFLLQSKPIISQDHGITCKFKALGKDTLMNCKTYPSNTEPLTDIRKHLKELKFDDIKYVSYRQYKKMNNL